MIVCKLLDNRVIFLCPGCGYSHSITIPKWTWNNNYEKPTFSPSLLVKSGHFVDSHKPGDECWCTFNIENPDVKRPFHCGICHSFIIDGKIQFLSDSTHKLAGQTVDLPAIEST